MRVFVIIVLITIINCELTEYYRKLYCTGPSSYYDCTFEIPEGAGKRVTYKYYKSTSWDGIQTNNKMFCNITLNPVPTVFRMGALNYKLQNGSLCSHDDDCVSDHCVLKTRECHALLDKGAGLCYQNRDCKYGLICTANKCQTEKSKSKKCDNTQEEQCEVGARCSSKGVCVALASVDNGQLVENVKYCKSQYTNQNGVCQSRSTLPKLKYDANTTYKICLYDSDCVYSDIPAQNGSLHCVFPDYSTFVNKTHYDPPLKYCKYGGGEHEIINAVEKYVSDLKYRDPRMNIINSKLFDVSLRLNYIEYIECSDEAYQMSYVPEDHSESSSKFPWWIVVFVAIAAVPILLVVLSLLC